MSYTNGPWEAVDGMDNENGVHSHIGIFSDGWHIARVWSDGPNPAGDARLIAAAPDMYESGKEMAEAVALLSADDGRIIGLLPILCRLRQALAKAEGRHA